MFCIPSGTTAKIKYIFSMKILYELVLVCFEIYGYCSGTPTNEHEEESEDIEIVLADREECKRILNEENVAIMCAYMLMHFIHTKGDPLAFLDEQ